MKNFKILFVALVAMIGLNSCSEDCDHVFNEHDHSADLVGTWTYMDEDFAEALVISADGSVVSTRLFLNEYRENIKGKIVVENGDVNLTFEDGGNFKSHFDIIPGMAFTIFNEEGERLTYKYCENDLSDEILGMWVCHEGLPGVENDMAIVVYSENGKMTMTTEASEFISGNLVNAVSSYVVVGDLLFMKVAEDGVLKRAARLDYTPNGTTLGDIFTQTLHAPTENDFVEVTSTFLRVKQSLNLNGQTYAYKSAYVTNAKGKDEDFTMFGRTFNMANINAANFDMAFGADLFCVVLNANSMTQKFRPDDLNLEVVTPITVDGNKVTLDYSAENPACRKVEIYMFQDKDNTQMHMYMPTSSFIDYIANMVIREMLAVGKIDPTDTAAIEKVYADMEARVESINVSFVFKAIEPVE